MILYSLAFDAAGNIIACQADSPNDQLLRSDADAFLGEGMRFVEEYRIVRSVALVEDVPPGATVVHEGSGANPLQVDGVTYRYAVKL